MVPLDLHFFTLSAGCGDFCPPNVPVIGFTHQSFSDFQMIDVAIISTPLV
jgi:hypothetical protein